MNYTQIRSASISSLWASAYMGIVAATCCAPAKAQLTATSPCRPQLSTLEVTDFGAKGDQSSDNMRPFEEAIAYAGKCSVATIHIPAGTYVFTPDGPANGLLLVSKTSLLGDGIGKTVLMVAADKSGANFDSFFWARNQDNIEIKGITFIGNNVVVSNSAGRPLNSYGSALSIALDAKAGTAANGTPRNLAHFVVTNSSFENFNGAAWIRVINYHDTYVIDGIEIRDNQFVSRENNAVNASDIGFPAFAISVQGSRTSTAGLVTNVRISGNTIDAAHLKGGVAIWSGVRGVIVADNKILDAGIDSSIPDDKGAYAIAVYNNAYYYDKAHPLGELMGGSRPDDVHIERNVITRPRSCGIYVAAGNRVWILSNEVSGQTDPENQTLPKGAIVLNHPTDGTVSGNKISSSHIGMTLLTGEHDHIAASNNSISNIPPGGFGIFPPRSSSPVPH